VCRPVERAEKSARSDGRIGGAQGAAADTVGHQSADAALVAIAFRDDEPAQPRREGVHLEVRGGSLEPVDQAEDVRGREIAQAIGQRPAIASRRGERGEQAVERSILAEEQQFVLAAEVVVQVAGREVRGDRDVAHPGGSEPSRAEHARRGAHDLDAAHVGPQ
jgi:hypothetical protein